MMRDVAIAGDDLLLRSHAACRDCGYDLFGQNIDKLCPEYGLSIRRSLVWGLEAANPRWLRRVALGIRAGQAGLLVVLFGVTGIVIDLRIGLVVLASGAALRGVAGWCLTAREPFEPESHCPTSIRWIVRASALLDSLLYVCLFATMHYAAAWPFAGACIPIATLFGTAGFMLALRQVAVRAPLTRTRFGSALVLLLASSMILAVLIALPFSRELAVPAIMAGVLGIVISVGMTAAYSDQLAGFVYRCRRKQSHSTVMRRDLESTRRVR